MMQNHNDMLDQPDDDLPIAVPLADDGLGMNEAQNNINDGNNINQLNAHFLARHGPIQAGRRIEASSTSYLYGMVQDPEISCASILGWGVRGCDRVVERCSSFPCDAYYIDPRTGRSTLHEACYRCSCLHIISALLEANPASINQIDHHGNTPINCFILGLSTQQASEDAGSIITVLLGSSEPTAASTSNRTGNLPLHHCCSSAPIIPFQIIKQILEANPAGAHSFNNRNQTPLSLHTQNRHASIEVARLLVDAFRDAIEIRDLAKGWSPLHYAADNGNHELIRLLLAANQEAAASRTTGDLDTPLHLLCRQNVSENHISAILSLIEAEPKALTIRNAKSLTPLHLICKRARVPFDVVKCIVDGDPDAASIPDCNNYLPIHHACETGVSPEVIACLLEANQASAFAKTKKNDSALSLACTCNKSTETVALLIRANPKALEETNAYGYVPLHCVCGAIQPRMGIVEEILKVCPNSSIIESHGETPMHIACGNPGSCVGVLELLSACKKRIHGFSVQNSLTEPALMTNKVGNTPLHYACFRGSPFEHIETLAMSNPQWVKWSNNAGQTPLQILCKNARLQDRVITTFSRIGGPAVFAVEDQQGNTPIHSALRDGVDVDAFRCLIRANPDALNRKTSYGNLPLHLACFRRVDPEIVREVALGGREPPILTPNIAGQTPLSIAIEEFASVCKSTCARSAVEWQRDQKRAFEILAVLVKILHYGSSSTDDRDKTGSLVRACISLHRRNVRLSPVFISRAIHLYPEEAKVLDSDGNYPLHVEASVPIEKMSLLDGPNDCTCAGNCHKRTGILRMLFEVYPHCCNIPNNAGEFPLSLVIQNGRPWDQTFSLMVRKFPLPLNWSLDIDRKFHPRILAKISRECGPGTLYQLITSHPGTAARLRPPVVGPTSAP